VQRPRTLVYVSKAFRPLVSLATSSPDDPDVQAITIVEGDSKILILNVYNEADQAESGLRTLERVVYKDITLNSSSIVLGDFNTHHPNWDPLARTSVGAREFVEWIEANNLNLLNTLGDTTFFRPNTRPSVLDLTLATPALASKIQDWQTLPDLGSDHLGVLFTIQGTSAPLVDSPLVLDRFDTAYADWDLFRSSIRRITNENHVILGFQADDEGLEGDESLNILRQCSTKTDDLELFASVLTEAITSAAKASIPLKKLSNRAKP